MPTALANNIQINSVRYVEQLDDHGLDCAYCSTEGAQVQAQIYYTIEEPHEDVFETGCLTCMFERMAEAARLGAYDFSMEVEQ